MSRQFAGSPRDAGILRDCSEFSNEATHDKVVSEETVSFKLHGSKFFCLFAMGLAIAGMFSARAAGAQTVVQASPVAAESDSAAQAAPSAAGILRGHILDPTGAVIPGAQVTVTTAKGAAAGTMIANATGAYVVRNLAAGSYIVTVTAPGFAPFVSAPIALADGQAKLVDVKMVIETTQQQVVVSGENGPSVSTEAGANANVMVLKGSDLDALSDDPDELSNELTALAGPSAGPNGGQIYIDGFTGGQLPPKSAIREIRINRNPFSAEYDRIGYGRIEILTKPGTDQPHGRFFGQGNDDVLNTKNPFTADLPSYYSDQFNGTVSGPLSHWASYFFAVEDREVQTDNVYSIPGGPVYDSTSNSWSAGQGSVAGSLFSPANHLEISPRVDLQLGQKNTLTLRYQFYRNAVTNGLTGTTAFPSLATSTDAIEHTFQLDDTQVITDRMINETRFEYRLANTLTTPLATAPDFGVLTSTAPGYNVPGIFSGGGSGTVASSLHKDHLELQNFTTMTEGRQSIEFGTWLRDNRYATSNSGDIYGNFTFPSVTAFLDTWNGVVAGKTFPQIAADCPATQTGGCLPTVLSYTTGPYAFVGNVFDGALFVQDDWTLNKNLTLSGGLRWETQNHIADHSDWAPRVAFAYALDGHKKGATSKTVLRGGFGFFYDRFVVADLMNLEMLNGSAHSQAQTVIDNPQCFSPTSLSTLPGGVASCGVGKANTPVIYSVSPSYRSPYMAQLGLGLERQVTKTSTVTLTYMHSSGFHQLVVRDANAYLPGDYVYNTNGTPTILAPRPNPNQGIVQQYFPEAVFNENQLLANFNVRLSPNFGLFGFYAASMANSDGGGGSNPSNSYNLRQDYGRAAFIHPQWLFVMGNYTGPWGISFNPFLIARAGNPYNIHSPYDLTGDNFFNDRPSYAGSAADPSDVVQTSFGALDVIPQSDENLIPMDLGTAPASVAVNLRVGRTIGIGPKVQSSSNMMMGPGGPHGHHGGPFGNPFGGGPHGPPGANTPNRKYALNFNVLALNLFNDIDMGTPHGGIQPTFDASTGLYGPGPEFGKSTGLAGMIFSTPSAARRVFFQMAFQF